jgi:hypothetical protein
LKRARRHTERTASGCIKAIEAVNGIKALKGAAVKARQLLKFFKISCKIVQFMLKMHFAWHFFGF